MNLFSFVFLLLFTLGAKAQVQDHLIYRCDELHWECVTKAEHKACEESRNQEMNEGKKDLSCAEFFEFPSARSCEQRILFLTTHNFGTRFCLGADFKQRELLF